MKYYNVAIDGGAPIKAEAGTELSALIGGQQRGMGQIVAAYVNNEVSELGTKLAGDCTIRFIDVMSPEGIRIYERSLVFTLVKAVYDLFPERIVFIRHSVRFDIFFEIAGESELLPDEVKAIEKRMRELAAAKIPFRRVQVPADEADRYFKAKERRDYYNDAAENRRPHVMFYELDGVVDYSYGCLIPDSGYLGTFSLQYRYPGAIMTMPHGVAEQARAEKYVMYRDVPKLLYVFAEYKNWGRILGIENIGDLNNAVRTGDAPDIIRIAEALQEKKISQIADQIANTANPKKLILISGPSSSGKTTFANRLSIQLRVIGYKTSIISMDDYFLDRADIPLGPDGEANLESPDALDIELFSSQMKALIAGQTVNAPIYNFKKSRRDERTRPLRVGDRQILIIEGIHGLNPKISASIPREHKYRIYISALTSLNFDDHNRISTTDTRLIRRIVRDHSFRGSKAAGTIGVWPSVRAGEEEYIFPYQESCDHMFNSGLIYELGAMKGKAQSLLSEIGPDEPEYLEASRLIRFLNYFSQISTDEIPPNSILREFLGGSCFSV